MPSLEKLHQRFKGNNFSLIAIDLQEKEETVQKAVRQEGVSFMNLIDPDGQISAMYGVRSTPMKMLIDKEGNLVGAALGYRDWGQEEINILVETLIQE